MDTSGALKGCLIQIPVPKAGSVRVQDCVPWGFEYLQGWTLHHLPGQHAPVFYTLTVKKKKKVLVSFFFFVSISGRCPLSCQWIPLRRAWVHLLYALPSFICMHWSWSTTPWECCALNTACKALFFACGLCDRRLKVLCPEKQCHFLSSSRNNGFVLSAHWSSPVMIWSIWAAATLSKFQCTP